MDAFSAAFGARLQSIRTGKDLSQEEVAARARISVQYISGIENGHFNPSHSGTVTSFGLKSIRERVEELGGSLDVQSQGNKGTRIIANIPTPKVGE